MRIPCWTSSRELCLQQARFRVELDWRDFDGRSGVARPVRTSGGDSGMLWFFEANNWEMLIKVLDGCALNDHHWVFAAGATTVEYTLNVTDTWTGKRATYSHPAGSPAPAVTDTTALAVCSATQP